ncbi:uncharacterized protein LOC127874738 isoform X2 [Dreissena polymorpha]|uniref:uncharacterized protein LOC127874738 isoform X2 n=1 Tax=Dreissena polymorpha TaxID=45954 RepID=UPI002264F612|nr:uncharacterized protein LOC127874738 isoform X2 [Dreissena polymorpha]
MSELDPTNLDKLKVAELQDELRSRGLDTKGKKAVLISRLEKEIKGGDHNASSQSIDTSMDGDADTSQSLDESSREAGESQQSSQEEEPQEPAPVETVKPVPQEVPKDDKPVVEEVAPSLSETEEPDAEPEADQVPADESESANDQPEDDGAPFEEPVQEVKEEDSPEEVKEEPKEAEDSKPEAMPVTEQEDQEESKPVDQMDTDQAVEHVAGEDWEANQEEKMEPDQTETKHEPEEKVNGVKMEEEEEEKPKHDNGRLASSPNEEGQILLTTKPTECTTVEIDIDLNNETSDVAEGNADADLQTASGSCSISALDKASTGDSIKSNTADALQTKTDTDKASTCEQDKQAEDIPTDDSKQMADQKKSMPKKTVPDIQKIENSDEDSYSSKSVESTDENYMEISDENLPDKQTPYLRTDGEAVVVDDDSAMIEMADSPAKQAETIPEFHSVKGGALKVAESTKPLASKPKVYLYHNRGFVTPVPKSLSKLKQLTVNIGPIRLIDLHCEKLHNILRINPTFEIKFDPKEKTLDNGIKIMDSCGFVRLNFEVLFPSILVEISDKLSDLNINGRDMSVKFPEAFNKAVKECKAWILQWDQFISSVKLKGNQRWVMTQQWPKEETSGEKLKSLFPQVDKIMMMIGKDYDDKDICLAVFLKFATAATLERFMNTGSSNIYLDGRLITFIKIVKSGVKPDQAPSQVSKNKKKTTKSGVKPDQVPSQVGKNKERKKNYWASAFGTRQQRGRGQGSKGRGGHDMRGRAGSMGAVRGSAGRIAISPRSTLHRAHYSPGGGQFKDLVSPHNQFDADRGTRKREKFEPQRDNWSHEPHDERRHQGDRWRSPSRFEHNKQRRSASESDETRAMLESMKSKLENMERKLAEQGGSMLPPVYVKKDVFPQGSRGEPAGKKQGHGRGACQPGQTHKQQGYQPNQQGYKSPRQQSPGQSFKPRTDLDQGQQGRGSSAAGRDMGLYRGHGKTSNKSGGRRKADDFTLDYQTSPKRQYSEENFKDTSFQYGAVDLWQQERYPNMQYHQTQNRATNVDRSQGDRGQGREHMFTGREHTFPQPFQEQGFVAPNTSYYQQF